MDSDGEYVEEHSDGGYGDHEVTSSHHHGGHDTRSSGQHHHHRSSRQSLGDRSRRKAERNKNGRSKAAWEDIQRSWDTVVEGADGSLSVGELLEAEKRRRLLRDTTPLQRGIIRHLMLVIDMSFAMAEKDMLPTRYHLAMRYAVEFVREYFEQNPISQLGIVGMRDGVAVRISDMSGNPTEHIETLRSWERNQEPQGNPSLQNALEMCRGALFHTPSHGTREVLIIFGALLSSDPGDIHDTIASLVADHIRVSVVGLAAQVAICQELCTRTNAGDDSTYAVALHDQHFRDLLLAATTPPVIRTREQEVASLLMMGFPSRSVAEAEGGAHGAGRTDAVSACACHNRPTREGYLCTRCRTKVCRLPAECPACGLTLVLSTHLARSYHHLFPLRNWVEVPWTEAWRSRACRACLVPFPEPPKGKGRAGKGKGLAVLPEAVEAAATTTARGARGGGSGSKGKPAVEGLKGISESGRYACEVCGNHFCIDCDLFAHEVVHNCPGCQSDTRDLVDSDQSAELGTNGKPDAANGEAMVIDS
ncbi:General transcription and DNA repair factor IIH [Pleurostoma richardsiae]|uniref:General transcription and DNA repair factor IIH n=1 Tax=Pleurostoma richardsiae TaxID=41990 RepID=A0AA38R9Y9_9PEZI|nr:General transcription and DNA repair factor IIH [Pleurostoma richardsiae]